MDAAAPAFWLPEDRLPLLRCLFLPDDEARAAWRRWRSTHDLGALDAPSFSLMPVVYKRLLALGERDPQQPIMKGLYRKTWFRNHVLQRHFFQSVEALERAGVAVMAVKGVAALRFYGGDSGVRPMLDTDFMVPHADVSRAIDALVAEGWVAKPASTPEYLKTSLVGRHHGWNFRRADGERGGGERGGGERGGGEIDVHWHLLPQDLSPHFDAGVWRHRRSAVVWGREVAVPDATEHLIQIFVHAAAYSLVPSSTWAADAGHILLRAGDEIDWERLGAVTIERRLILPVRDALAFLRRALDAPMPAAMVARLDAAPVFDVERLEYEAAMMHPLQHSALHHKARRHMREARLATGAELERRAAIPVAALAARPVAPPVPAPVSRPAAHARATFKPAPAGRKGMVRCVSGWRPGTRRG